MAEELNVSTATISRAFKKYGIKRGRGCSAKFNPQNKPKITKETLEKYKDLSKEELALMFNVDKSYIHYILKKYGLN